MNKKLLKNLLIPAVTLVVGIVGAFREFDSAIHEEEELDKKIDERIKALTCKDEEES